MGTRADAPAGCHGRPSENARISSRSLTFKPALYGYILHTMVIPLTLIQRGPIHHGVPPYSQLRMSDRNTHLKIPHRDLGHIRAHNDHGPPRGQCVICWGKRFGRGALLQGAIYSLDVAIDTRGHTASVDLASVHLFMPSMLCKIVLWIRTRPAEVDGTPLPI